ncbi:class I adenylate-forming enzyme family protein [uncultured Corynebacterium sp.]|uniref:class I adenylate-forming enzyme family protein n=1 Tax=uncultured Corynebacterium sp. TaxID=159447 RepID=UPI0025ED606D|nr:AMP-binding protein [uncultured Corynebacterium sp.]
MPLSPYFSWDLAHRGDLPCVRDDDTTLTYRDFARRTDAAAAQFRDLGVGRGDVIATFLPNRVEILVTMMAAWRLGAVMTPVNPGFTETEARHQLEDSDARLIVGDTPGHSAAGRTVLGCDDLHTEPDPAWLAPEPPGPADIALLIYTSGSTGRPKGVQQTHANIATTATALVEHMGFTADDHALLILPLFHANAIYASFLPMMIVGGQLSITGTFSVRRFFTDVERLRPTYFSGVPTIYSLLVTSPDLAGADTSSLNFAICGAAPASPELIEAAQSALDIPLIEGYGLTEGACVTTCNPRHGVRRPGTVGVALPGQEIAVLDDEGEPLPTGTPGEVAVRGPNIMRGYLNRPDATAETVVDGWLHTGDIGFLDVDGYLTLIDRKKDMIIRGGENIYPKEIESALTTHAGVLECAVVGEPDPVLGEVPVAFVVSYPGAEITGDDLIEHLRPQLARIKLPRTIQIVGELPRNPVGKIDKPALRDLLRVRRTAAAS